MICSHPDCTGNHNDRKFATLCPRTKEAKRQQARDWERGNPWYSAKYRTTAAYMVAQAKHDAHRRGHR